jgi:ABC-type hemin transport system substrate-binding protein
LNGRKSAENYFLSSLNCGIFATTNDTKMSFKRILFVIVIIGSAFLVTGQQKYAIVIHGGAGVMSEEKMSKEQQNEYKSKLNEALELGEKMLKEGRKPQML